MMHNNNNCWTTTYYSRKGLSRGENNEHRVVIKRGPHCGSEGRILSRTKNGWLRIALYPMGSKMVIKIRNSPFDIDKPLTFKNKSCAWWVAGDSKMLKAEQAENLAAMESDWVGCGWVRAAGVEGGVGPWVRENPSSAARARLFLEAAPEDQRYHFRPGARPFPPDKAPEKEPVEEKVREIPSGCLPGCVCPEQGLHHKLCPNNIADHPCWQDGEWAPYNDETRQAYEDQRICDEWDDAEEVAADVSEATLYENDADEVAAWAMFEDVLTHRNRQEDEEGQQGEGGFDEDNVA